MSQSGKCFFHKYENQSWIVGTHVEAHNSLLTGLGDLSPSSGLCEPCTHMVHRHICREIIHIR